MSKPAAEQATEARRPRPFVTWLKRLALVAVLALAILAVYRNYEALRGDLHRLSLWAVILAYLPGVVGMMSSLQVWRALMRELGSPLPPGPASRIFFVSQLGKYLPGTLWSVMAQMELGREYKVPRRTSLSVGLLVLAVSVVGGITVAVVLLPFAGGEMVGRYWWLALTLPFLYVGLHPRILSWVLDSLMRVVRRPPLQLQLSGRGIGRALFYQSVTWVLLGFQVWILLVALGSPRLESLPLAVGGYALGYSLGMLAFVLPAGAGVREGTLVLAVAQVAPGSTALLVALIARALATVCDVMLAAIELVRWRATSPEKSPQRR